jgi:hypothetical protein
MNLKSKKKILSHKKGIQNRIFIHIQNLSMKMKDIGKCINFFDFLKMLKLDQTKFDLSRNKYLKNLNIIQIFKLAVKRIDKIFSKNLEDNQKFNEGHSF